MTGDARLTEVDHERMKNASQAIDRAEKELKATLVALGVASMDWHAAAGSDSQDGDLQSQSQKAHDAKSKHGEHAAKVAADAAEAGSKGADLYQGTEDDNLGKFVRDTTEAVMAPMKGMFGLG